MEDTDDLAEWNVLDDLNFLFVNDDALRTELSYVCDLLSETGGSDAAPPSGLSPPPPPSTTVDSRTTPAVSSTKRKAVTTNPSRVRQQEQIKLLRNQVDDLKAQLLDAEQNAASRFDLNAWKRVARQEQFEKSKAMAENEHLRAEVHGYATFIEDMQKLMRKKPRLTMQTDMQSVEWQTYRLAAQASLRVAAIHAIADRQYRRLQSAFVQAGLLDRTTDDVVRATPMPQPDNSVVLEYVYHVTLAAPYDRIGAAVWKVFNGENGPKLPDGATQTFEQVDTNTIYQAYSRTRPDDGVHGRPAETVHSNNVWKYFQEPPDREVIVWRAVLDDALVPHMANGAVHDEWGWATVVPLDDPSMCRLTLLLQIVTDPAQPVSRGSADALIEATIAQIEKFSFLQPPAEPGTFPSAPVDGHVPAESKGLPFVKQTFIQRGRLLELALKEAIDVVIADYRGTRT